MARFFDAQAALSELQGSAIRPIHPIPEPSTAENRTNRVNRVPPNVEFFEERAAIAEFDGGLTRPDAEDLAAQAQGYDNVIAFKAALNSKNSGGSQ